MLSAFDDYPIHQTPDPIAHVQSGDANAYDRYFFHGYDREGAAFFGAALGVYPNRRIIDASFSIVREGVQRSVHASGRLPFGERPTRIGPISIDVVEPLHTLRITVDDYADNLGLAADITFVARTPPVEEPRHTTNVDGIVLLDATRLTQWGDWSGTIRVDGETLTLDPSTHIGIRDRSWGIRPVGDPAAGAPSHDLPQIFWFWSPIRFDDRCLHGGANEHEDGRQWFRFAHSVPILDPGASPESIRAAVEEIEPFRSIDATVEWIPGARRARHAEIAFTPWNADPVVVSLDPIARFPLRGLGYIHPEWGHGHWHDELAVATESWVVDDLDPTSVHNLHEQQLCRAIATDGRSGIGVLEQLVLGPHVPSGINGFLEGA